MSAQADTLDHCETISDRNIDRVKGILAASMESNSQPTRARQSAAGEKSLMRILLTLTFVTGIVDAVSVLGFGRVFTANMTGNVVFLAFAVAGEAGFSMRRSLTALVGFLAGAVVGARRRCRCRRRGHGQGHHHRWSQARASHAAKCSVFHRRKRPIR